MTLLTWVGLIFHKRSDGMMLKQIYKQINTFTKLTYFNNKNNNSWISNFTFLKCRTHLLELGAQMRGLKFSVHSNIHCLHLRTGYDVHLYSIVQIHEFPSTLYNREGWNRKGPPVGQPTQRLITSNIPIFSCQQ